ncbi:hypothetical protein GF324_00400 [bacterium]|nr:hypothetical protein [bacterium]
MDGATAGTGELTKSEMLAAAFRGQTHAGGAAQIAGQQASAAGLTVQDSVELSSEALQLSASAAADTE